MINVRIIRRAKSQTGTGAGTAYSGGTAVIAGTVDEAKHAYEADRAGSAEYADKSGYADTAGTATRAHTADNLADDFEYPDRWIRNDESDTASGDLYTFEHDVTVTEDTVHGGTTTHNGQTTHNARAVFKQHFDLPNESVGRIAGTLHFANTIEQAGTAQPNGSISGTGIAQLKKMTLTGPDTAGQYDTLDVTGTSIMRDIIGPYSGSVRFEDGFTGHGFRIWKDENNAYHITADFLTIRQQMKVFELLIQKIRSTAGSIVVSDANGKIKRVEEMTIASENDTWLIWFETDHDFAPGDIMRVQSWKGLGTSAGSYENTSWWGVVGAVQTIDGEKVVLMSKSTWSGSVPKEGDEVVQWGNTGVTPGRDKILYLTAAENDQMGISMYEDVNIINGGTLTLKIGDLSGINDSVFGQLSGWGLYAQSVYLRSDNIVGSDGKTISQRFQAADGKLESAIDGMRAKTSGDSIVKNHDLSDVTDNYPDYWHPYNIDGTPLSDTTSILSDGHTALGAYGTGEAYTAYFDDGVNRYLRIINTGESADCGIYQDVGDMRQDLWASGETRTAKNVSFSFRYRMTAGSEMSVYFHSGFMSREGVCDSSVTSDTYTIYGLKKALTADGKWHTATYFGTYVGGSGQLRFLAKGTVDVTDVECLVAEELQYTNSRFVQTDERITAEVASVNQHIDGQVEVLSGRISTEAGKISALSTRVNTLDGDVQELKTSGFVARDDFAGLFTANLHDAPGFYDVTYDEQGNPVYTLKLITLQSAEAAAQSEISSYIESDLDKDLTDRNVARKGDVSQLRADTLSTFISGSEMTAQLSGYYEKDSNGKLVYWTTEDEDYKASDWDNPTSTPTEGKKYFIVTYTEDGVTTHRLAVYDKWKMSDPDARVIEFVPKFTIKAQISTMVRFDPETGEIVGDIYMKADNIIQLADKIQAVAREMTFTADHINFNGYVNANGLKIDTDGNVTTFGVVNNGRLTLVDSNLSNYLYGNDKYLDVLRCPPTLYVDAVTKITLPCAWLAYDGFPVESGRTKFTSNHDTETESSDNGWYEHNLADLRAMIGKKIRIYIANPTSGIYADLLVLVSGHEVDYIPEDMGVFNGDDEPVITPTITKQWVCYPLPNSRGRKFDPIGVISGAGASNTFLECECKTGKWKGSECIYWEVKAVVNTLDVRYETE